MSTRERWTIYPLLFLTLSIVLKDKLTKVLSADVVYCKSLVVTDRNQQERVVVSSNPAGGIVKTDSSDRRVNVLLGHAGNQHGVIYTDGGGNILGMGLMVRPPQPPPPNPEGEAASPPQVEDPAAPPQGDQGVPLPAAEETPQ